MRWLQVGAATAGMGLALAAAQGTAFADDGAAGDTGTKSVHQNASTSAGEHRGVASARRSVGASTAVAPTAQVSGSGTPRSAAVGARQQRAAATSASTSDQTVGSDETVAPVALTAQADSVRSTGASARVVTHPAAAQAVVSAATADSVAAQAVVSATTANGVAAQVDPLGNLAAFFGLPGAPATAAPSLGAFPILLRLTLDDLVSGTGPAAVTNPTAVVTGLFNQVLRTDPTSAELQNYLGIMQLTGVNGVIAGLYSSTLFRQTEVNNYYLELLSRNATSQELAWNTTALMWGMPEPLFAASIAGSPEFYRASSAGGGPLAPMPSATAYVDNLYRTLLGTPPDPAVAAAYIQQIQAGLPIGLAALQFVTSDVFRQAKVQEIYSVLGETATQAQINSAVQNWYWDGGLAGIATALLATSSNTTRIEAGQVALPNMVAVGQLKQLLLAAYTSDPDGFVKTLNSLLNVDANNPCTASSTTCNQALYALLTGGGIDRGLVNGALTVTYGSAPVATLIPTQNEIDLAKSLSYVLTDPAALAVDFAGGVVVPGGGGAVLTADDGTYIVDGHHRWSAIYLVNPSAQVATIDIGYVPDPQTALKETQIGIVAQLGYLKVSTGGGINVYTVGRSTFDTAVSGWITTGAQKDAVLAVFRKNLGIPDTATEAEQLTAIQNYLWTNVQRMRALNPYIPGATSRDVMPQAEPIQPILSYLQSGLLSYSFPVISYLG
ncbi:hypothetical protein BayCH28_09910 [Mycolicibacterium sp. CH28]|uniref:hypothetical protein n=1 Tax=Mycolicibacterium sp. CH28 TaxID=2512237 RepID=UPI0010803841|nr:hypothetical protein [Mycolicibacterium sp. CH28]TGD88086.1 hypothetical protein BayCH28_09910 [Mycolicibacterium sp. CH28]